MFLTQKISSKLKYLLNTNIEKVQIKLLHRNYSNNKTKTIEEHRKDVMKKGLPKIKPIQGVKEILLICSGKGGVGKSTTAVNLATALKIIQPEKKVGLLDTDIFGPSIPLMMNLNETPFLTENNLMEPLQNYGIKCMSMGFLIDQNAPVIWRGLMVMQALEKLMRQVDWGEIDYLIVDTPPGTGDTQLSLVQNLPISGVILVTTPQNAAIQVTKRGANMFKKLNIPIVGLIENMSEIKCPKCDENIKIFGENTRKLADELNVEILENFPLERSISEKTDQGVPIVLDIKCKESGLYRNLAGKVVEYINNKNKE